MFAAETSSSALCRGVEGMSDNVAFAELSIEAAIGVRAAARSSSAPLHTCLIVEKPEKIQLAQGVAGLPDTVNNTSLKKHPPFGFRATEGADARRPDQGAQNKALKESTTFAVAPTTAIAKTTPMAAFQIQRPRPVCRSLPRKSFRLQSTRKPR